MAPTATPRLPVAIGTALPASSVALSPQNVDQVVELARWGKGVNGDLAYSPDGKAIALASASGLEIVTPDTLDELASWESDSPALKVAYSPDGTVLATALQNGTIAVWNAQGGDLLQTLANSAEGDDCLRRLVDGTSKRLSN